MARPQRLKGSGYGSDDWTILHCLLLLIPINVLVQTMTDNGLGMDNYDVPASQITAMLEVSLLMFTTSLIGILLDGPY